MKKCRRSVKEQHYIRASLDIWPKLPETRREGFRALIAAIAHTPEESRALFDVLVKDRAPEAVSRKTAVPIGRIYDMKREFYERAEV